MVKILMQLGRITLIQTIEIIGVHMSIYVVRLKEWFPKGDENHQIARWVVSLERCQHCGKKPRWRNARGYHALPWGYSSEVWCNQHCFKVWNERKT